MKTRIVITLLVTLGIIVPLLMHNRSQLVAEPTSDFLMSVPVSVLVVSSHEVLDAKTFVGAIEAGSDVVVVSETDGKITEILADVGQYKESGTIIARVDAELKQANLEAAQSASEKAKNNLDRYESLYKQNAATEGQIETARQESKATEAQFVIARRQLRDTRISTPIAGIVTARFVERGTYIQHGTPVANVVDISTLKVNLDIPERDVVRLNIGDRAEVSTDVYPGEGFMGTVSSVSSKAAHGRLYLVEVKLANSKVFPLRGGMLAKVKFGLARPANQVTIPRGALIGSVKNPQVYILEGSVARLRSIVVDPELNAELTVREGLRPGDTVVVRGQYNLKDSLTVTITNEHRQ